MVRCVGEFALHIGNDDAGSYSEAELRLKLEEYREQNPDDPLFSRILVWEMQPGGLAGRLRSVYDFIDKA